jgi:hypothetical protein
MRCYRCAGRGTLQQHPSIRSVAPTAQPICPDCNGSGSVDVTDVGPPEEMGYRRQGKMLDAARRAERGSAGASGATCSLPRPGPRYRGPRGWRDE